MPKTEYCGSARTEAPARTIDDARVIVADILKSASMGDADEVASCRKALRFLSDDAALEDELNANGVAALLVSEWAIFYSSCLLMRADPAAVVMAMVQDGCTKQACKQAFGAADRAGEFQAAWAAAALQDAA